MSLENLKRLFFNRMDIQWIKLTKYLFRTKSKMYNLQIFVKIFFEFYRDSYPLLLRKKRNV